MAEISALQIDSNQINLVPGFTVSLFGTLGATDGFDSYDITINEPQLLEVNLFDIITSADIIVNDSNGNPIPGGAGSQPLSTPENFTIPLNPGNYQVLVFQPLNDFALGGTNYQLDLASISSNNPPINPPINPPVNPPVNPPINPPVNPPGFTDNTNNSINTATPLGSIFPEIPITRSATINDFDTVDYYRVTVEQPITSGVALQNITGNLDVEVLDSNGNLIASGNNLGSSNEAFQAPFFTPGEYFINVFQTAPGITSNYDLTLFPASANISPPPPPNPQPTPPPPNPQPTPPPPNPQPPVPANPNPVPPPPNSNPIPQIISFDGQIDGSDEVVRNREDTSFVFKEDFLLNATPGTPLTIDLTGINSGFDPLLEVYQLPPNTPVLEANQQAILVAANDNGGGGVNAIIGPGAPSDVTILSPGTNTPISVPAELTLAPEFQYLLRLTYTELPIIPVGGFSLNASVPDGFISLAPVRLGVTVGDPIVAGDPSINEFPD
ncbi:MULTISPECIES: PPC domain-containing protein [unclassified Okeania]|uniref:PPC domain-containing protein n=1 Tax=unclassified Okeania TaxID=2634635 RepID=UPI002580FAB1|nr:MULTISPECIES: PPC domain-containing protein [unclassified Okeania]